MVAGLRKSSGTPADLLVVGLGNPGEQYATTRHNAGFWVVNELVRRHHGRLRRGRREFSESDVLIVNGLRIAVAVPTTFYNRTGQAVQALLKVHRLDDLSRLLIVHDELDLPVGVCRLKFGGGFAGNNGLKSVNSHLRTSDFSRLRLGVDKPSEGTQSGADYVLRRPARAEQPILEQVVATACDAVEYLAATDIETAMNRFNQR
jgi:PTH1 family peptidyl-tRNA hydrolase